jgi:hypothetical protein
MIRAIGRTGRRERRRRRGLPNGGGVLFLDQRAIAGSGGAGLLGWIPGVAKNRRRHSLRNGRPPPCRKREREVMRRIGSRFLGRRAAVNKAPRGEVSDAGQSCARCDATAR